MTVNDVYTNILFLNTRVIILKEPNDVPECSRRIYFMLIPFKTQIQNSGLVYIELIYHAANQSFVYRREIEKII